MVKSTLACGLQECLSKEWMGDNFSDFRVVVDGSEYSCHKFILSACSSFFKVLLRTNFREKKEERVELKNMSKETFEVIINAIYKGVDGLTLDNIIRVWQASHMLDIPFLIEECEQFVITNMTLDNYIAYYHMARLLNSETVITSSIGFMKENFEHFSKTETFLELSFPLLFSLVDDDRLNVKTEDIVLSSIINWVSYVKMTPGETNDKNAKENETKTNSLTALDIDKNCVVQSSLQVESQESNVNQLSLQQHIPCETTDIISEPEKETFDRKKSLVELLSAARIFLVSRSYLEKLLIHPLMKSSDEAHEIVYEALLYQWRSVSFPSNVVIPYRNCSGKRNVMAFVRNEKLHLFELNSQHEIEMGLGLKCGNILASTESTLCFYYLNEEAACEIDTEREQRNRHWCSCINIATLDSGKKVQDTCKICGRFGLNLVSFNGIFINVSYNLSRNEVSKFKTDFLNIENSSLVSASYVCVFQDYILGFSTKRVFNLESGSQSYFSKAVCFNFYTKSTEEVTFEGCSENITSIQKGRHVFILQKNGALRSVGITEDKNIEFTFVIQLWENFDWILKGAVYFKNELILFCSEKHKDVDTGLLKSVPGVFERIRVVELETQSNVVPLVVPESWIISKKK